jgi:hypothetical protein
VIRTYLALALSGLCAAVGFATVGIQAENTRCGESLVRCQEDIIRLTERNNVNRMLLSGSWQEQGVQE